MISYLASYPKSGNTWVRIFLDAYLRDEDPDINRLGFVMTDNAPLTHDIGKEFKANELPGDMQIYTRYMSLLRIILEHDYAVLKTHNANVKVNQIRLFPPDITDRVVYLIRDPRDVAVSYAKHFGHSVDEAIDNMIHNGMGLIAPDKSKMIDWMTSWGWHVKSFVEAKDLDVTVVKYEELKTQPIRMFKWILEWLRIEIDEQRVERAISRCAIQKLRRQEKERGFKEKSEYAEQFFGNGGNWRSHLKEDQIVRIESAFGNIMDVMGYERSVRVAA